jgi:hypothetical protein
MYRKTAVVVGALFFICTGATLLSYPFGGAFLEKADYLAGLAQNESSIITAALIEFVWAASCAGIAMALYPVLRRSNSALALGAAGFRTVEMVFVLVGTLCLLALLSLSRSSDPASTASLQASGTLLLSLREWSHNVISFLAFSVGALMYYAVFFTSRIIPRWLSGWGFLGALLAMAATIYAAFTNSFDTGMVHTYLSLPIALNEMVLAFWLIIKGFSPVASAQSPSWEAVPEA